MKKEFFDATKVFPEFGNEEINNGMGKKGKKKNDALFQTSSGLGLIVIGFVAFMNMTPSIASAVVLAFCVSVGTPMFMNGFFGWKRK